MTGQDHVLKLVDAEPDPDHEYRLQDQIGFLLRRAHQRHVAIFASNIAGLTPPQFAALVRLREVGETSQNQLGTLIAMDAATVKGVIDRLKSRGLVEIEKSEADKRRLMVRLTQKGRGVVEELIPRAVAISSETLSPLSRREAATLIKLLSKIV